MAKSIADLKRDLLALPKTLAYSVAQRAAPELTRATVDAFISDRTVYGEERPAGVHGNTLELRRTGTTRDTLKFVANGTIVRCVLGTKYARFLIGKYGILPNGAIPADWERRLGVIVHDTKVDQ